MINIREAIVVEGKYDKIRLESAVRSLIIETDGFRIFKDKDKLRMLREIAKARGLIVLTDSDSAGFVIRNYLIGTIPSEQIRHAYIPEIRGKERRKAAPSKEGLLGVEGVDAAVLEEALTRAGATFSDYADRRPDPLTRLQLYEDGLIGAADSAARRTRLLKQLGYPQKLSVNRLLEVLNATVPRAEYDRLIQEENTAQPADIG